jgi:hypothetical protein
MSFFNLNISKVYYNEIEYDIFYIIYRPIADTTSFVIPSSQELENSEKNKKFVPKDFQYFRDRILVGLQFLTFKEKFNLIKKADNTTVFMRHENDRVEFKNGEQINIDIYDNDILIFSGHKYELFEKLKENKEI